MTKGDGILILGVLVGATLTQIELASVAMFLIGYVGYIFFVAMSR